MAQRFQVKKLNKEDHKKVDKTAEGIKAGVSVVSVLGAGVIFIKKYGKPIVNRLKNLIIK